MFQIKGVTLQVRVINFKQGELWYRKLLGCPPSLVPHGNFAEWEISQDVWLQVAEGESERGRPIRFGVRDIYRERERIISELDTEVSEVRDVNNSGEIALWCDFEDPFGNKLGLFQDLKKYPADK